MDHEDFSNDCTILICFLSPASVTLYLLVNDTSFGLTFESSTYEFSIEENKAPGTAVGSVKALSGSIAAQIGYSLKSHWDKFSIGDQGDIVALVQLDREEGDLYSVLVEAVDSLVPPNTAVALVWNTHFKIFFIKEYEISLKNILTIKQNPDKHLLSCKCEALRAFHLISLFLYPEEILPSGDTVSFTDCVTL